MADTDLFAKFDEATLEYLKAKWADRNLPDMHPQSHCADDLARATKPKPHCHSHGHLEPASRCIFFKKKIYPLPFAALRISAVCAWTPGVHVTF
jgi:hypothetical protein